MMISGPVGARDGPTVSATTTLTFAEGTSNYIQWRASDLAGNGLATSLNINVKVDTGGVSFTDPTPAISLTGSSIARPNRPATRTIRTR
jgi:hypothetical protein